MTAIDILTAFLRKEFIGRRITTSTMNKKWNGVYNFFASEEREKEVFIIADLELLYFKEEDATGVRYSLVNNEGTLIVYKTYRIDWAIEVDGVKASLIREMEWALDRLLVGKEIEGEKITAVGFKNTYTSNITILIDVESGKESICVKIDQFMKLT